MESNIFIGDSQHRPCVVLSSYLMVPTHQCYQPSLGKARWQHRAFLACVPKRSHCNSTKQTRSTAVLRAGVLCIRLGSATARGGQCRAVEALFPPTARHDRERRARCGQFARSAFATRSSVLLQNACRGGLEWHLYRGGVEIKSSG